MEKAINKSVTIAELIKRRIPGIHQHTSIGSIDITDIWESKEEGLLPIETTRHVLVITITLSKKELNTSAVGYQCPIPIELGKPFVEIDYEGREKEEAEEEETELYQGKDMLTLSMMMKVWSLSRYLGEEDVVVVGEEDAVVVEEEGSFS
ncbi:uncharacterized protein LOC125576139 [Brassica napus]|uniref:uncharacterized protein LOC111199365 n=1 Tax=Brassica napus TaxID=3708 RepID=UPI000BBE8393|nr:uncharacterized protein LOC111199365 [Brassica napus]XP_048591479.1 uncharacterized protein LOC125576139 [Brassica napus]